MFMDIQKSTSCGKQRSWNKSRKEGEICTNAYKPRVRLIIKCRHWVLLAVTVK